jgi:hypothetical protein
MSTFAGVRIIESAEAYEPIEDWSRVRSPSRAERRRQQGHRQNIIIRHKPIALQHVDGTLIVHPAIADQLRREISAKMDAEMRRAMYGYRGL